MEDDPNKSNEPTQTGKSEMPESWEKYLEGQPEEIKGLYTAHVEGLKSTVKATRTERDQLAKQMKDLAKAAEEGSEIRKKLDEMTGMFEESERRAQFLEDAPGAQCKNAKAAWMIAKAGNHFNRNGQPDWNAIKAEAPELFGIISTKANAGTGTNNPASGANTMNEIIRRAAGRS